MLVVCDTLRADHLDLYGYERPTAPGLAAWARDALVFDEATAPCNWTRPSMLSLFSGRHPDAGLVLRRTDRFPERAPSLPELLRDAGYETAGVTANPYMIPALGADRGFDTFLALGENSDQLTGHEGTRVASPFVVDRVEYLLASRERTRPLFLYVHLMDSHMPYDPPEEHRTWVDPAYDGPARWTVADYRVLRGPRVDERLAPDDREHVVALYDGEIRQLDASLARLRALVDEHLGDRPVVTVVTSDHGEAFGEGRDNHYLHGYGLGPELLRVPLVVAGVPRTGRVATRVGLVDLLPTLAELAGVQPPPDIDGRSLLRATSGRPYIAYRALDGEGPGHGELAVLLDELRAERLDDGWRLFRAATGDDVTASDPELLEQLRAHAERWHEQSLRRRSQQGEVGTTTLDPELEAALDALGYAGQ